MTFAELRDNSSHLKMEKQAFINDTYMWVKLARSAISDLPDDKIEFSTPKTKKPDQLRTVSRNHPEKTKERIINKDIFNSAFVLLVASVEDYFSKIIEWILKTDTKRIKCTINGVNMIDKVSVVDLIDNDKETLIENIIKQRLSGLFYASPQKQLEYLKSALDIEPDEDLWGKWMEIKARRDLIVHNNGIVNQIYLNKASSFSLCSLGDEALIDENYFKMVISSLKSLIGKLDVEIRTKYIIKKPNQGEIINETAE